jgi:hypothetical protein
MALRRLQSPRTERMTEKSAVTPSVMSVQTQKKIPLEFAILPQQVPPATCGRQA